MLRRAMPRPAMLQARGSRRYYAMACVPRRAESGVVSMPPQVGPRHAIKQHHLEHQTGSAATTHLVATDHQCDGVVVGEISHDIARHHHSQSQIVRMTNMIDKSNPITTSTSGTQSIISRSAVARS